MMVPMESKQDRLARWIEMGRALDSLAAEAKKEEGAPEAVLAGPWAYTELGIHLVDLICKGAASAPVKRVLVDDHDDTLTCVRDLRVVITNHPNVARGVANDMADRRTHGALYGDNGSARRKTWRLVSELLLELEKSSH